MSRNRYAQIIEKIFLSRYKDGAREVGFEREDLVRTCEELCIPVPKNLGDIVYSFRYRATMPDGVKDTAPEGEVWIIRPVGKAQYLFALVADEPIAPNPLMSVTKVPDSTPGIIAKYALSDEQALLARVRYNRLIDIFSGVTCYSLQNHLRTTVPAMGQVETDELYIGVDKRGAHYVFPVQAKGGSDKLSVVQIEQDIALCKDKFPGLICRPIAAQFMEGDLIVLFEFEEGSDRVTLSAERHYLLVPHEDVTTDDLDAYRQRSEV